MQRTASAAILDRLVDADVLAESEDRVALTDEFRAVCEPQQSNADGTGDVSSYETALDTFGVGLDSDERAAAAAVLADLSEISGTFVSVTGDDLGALLEQEPQVVVLVYKEGCDPCERVRSKLTQLDEQGTIPDDVVIATLLGTECQRLLWDEYDVVGAPTVLFGREGRIEMRLTGDIHLEQLHSDIQRLYA